MKKIILILVLVVVLLTYVSADISISNFIPLNNFVLPPGTTSTTLSISSNDDATCKYSNSSEELFSSMDQFSTTGGTQHNSVISGLQDAQSYNYYIKCQNISDLTDISDYYHMHFFVLDVLLEQCFPDQLGYWTFDHFNNNIVYDILGNNYATIYGGVTQSQPGQVGDGFNFNGEDGYIDVNGLDGVLPNSSFGLWITPDQDYGLGSDQTAPVVLLSDGLTEIFIDTDGSIKETQDGTTTISSPAITWNQGESYHILRTPSKFYLGTGNGCQISETFSFNESNPEEIAPGSYVNLTVDNGCSPFNWSVSGTGFSLATEIESNGTNILYASGSACGVAEVNVTDSLGQNVTGYVRSTAGQWILKSFTCGLSGTATSVDYPSAGVIHTYKINGYQKQYVRFIDQVSGSGLQNSCNEALDVVCNTGYDCLDFTLDCSLFCGSYPTLCSGMECRKDCSQYSSWWYIDVCRAIQNQLTYYEWECIP